MLKSVNWVGVIVATIVVWLLGWLWYGMVFEAKWMALTGMTEADAAASGMTPMVLGFLNTLLTVIGLGLIVPRLGDGWMGGAKTGLLAGLLFACTTAAMGFIYTKQDTGLIPIDFGYLIVLYVVAGAIVGGLRMGKPSVA